MYGQTPLLDEPLERQRQRFLDGRGLELRRPARRRREQEPAAVVPPDAATVLGAKKHDAMRLYGLGAQSRGGEFRVRVQGFEQALLQREREES